MQLNGVTVSTTWPYGIHK